MDFEPSFHLRYVTEDMTHLSGFTQEELLGMGQMALVKDEEVDLLVQEVAEQFAKSDTFEVKYKLKRKDGSFVYVLDRAKVMEHEDGKKYIHCLLTDITCLKQMEQELRLSEEKYKLAIQKRVHIPLFTRQCIRRTIYRVKNQRWKRRLCMVLIAYDTHFSFWSWGICLYWISEKY